MSARPVELVKQSLEARGCRGRGSAWTCPAHDDRRASFSLSEGRDGRALLKCHAGCSLEDILAALGLEERDLFPEEREERRVVATYPYVDDNGELLFEVVRYHPKDFRQRRPDGRSGWIWNLDGTRRVLYRLPRVLEAVRDGVAVYVVEGEKDVHALEGLGVVATTNPGGAGSWRPEYAEALRGARVVVVADRDEAGRRHAREVARSLEGVAERVTLLEPPAPFKDVSDLIAAGGTVENLVALPEEGGHQRDPVPDLASVLDEVHDTLARYVVFPSPEALDAATLYVSATHAQPAWEHATRLVFESPLKRCGKTRALEVFRELVHNALPAGSISTAALVRSIDEDDPPTVILDEADVIFGKARSGANEGAEDLRGILNNGYSRGWPYRRWNPKARKPEECPTFAMAILAAIGTLPDTIEDRAIVITMRRRAPSEHVAAFRTRRALPWLHDLRDRLHRAVRARLKELVTAEPDLPVEDRAADCWEPLVAIADAAGGSWPERARRACLALEQARAGAEDATASERLLTDLREVWGEEEALPTKEILARLHALEEAPWADWYGRPLSARDLARLLRPYGVRSSNLRLAGSVLKGYLRADLEDPWRRYVGTPAATSATSATGPGNPPLTSADGCSGNVADGASDIRYAPDQRGYPSGSAVADVADGVPERDTRTVAEEDLPEEERAALDRARAVLTEMGPLSGPCVRCDRYGDDHEGPCIARWEDAWRPGRWLRPVSPGRERRNG